MESVVTLTINPAIDKSTTVHVVAPERKLRCSPPRYDPGGGGINVSRAIKHLGGDSLAIYAVGGTTGDMLQSLLEREDVRQRPIPIAGLTREDLHVTEESTAQQYRFTMPGPEMEEHEWKRCIDEVEAVMPAPEFVVASGSLSQAVPDDFYARVARTVAGMGSRFILDTSGEALVEALKEPVYLIKPNIRELGHLAGSPIAQESEIAQCGMKLIRRRLCEAVVVSIGSAGAVLVSGEGACRFRAPTVPAASKVGAGDSMLGGIVFRLAMGDNLSNAVKYGIAAGAAAVLRPGTQLCRLEDTERLYASMPAAESL